MKNCCQSTKIDNKCKRITDGKEFDLPRKYSKKRCMSKIAGFTMRASCAPYKGCKKKKTMKGGLSKQYNLYNKPLKVCSTNPVTGYNRSGYCSTDMFDSGSHLICAKMNKRFLESTKKDGNDLTTPGISFPGLKSGDRWCLCQDRWYQAYKKGKAPKVIKTATNSKIRKEYKDIILKKTIKGGSKKQLLFNPDDPKKSFDVYIDKDPSDTIPIKYTTIQDVKRTIRKLERLFKEGKYSHKRIWQVCMILRVRLKVLKKKKPEEYKLAERYFKFLGQRTKLKTFNERKKFTFKI
jgi:uncharacterized protein (DUF2237 family)